MGNGRTDGVRGAGQDGRRPVFTVSDVIEPSVSASVPLTYFANPRIGELLGLRRRDVDLTAGTLRIERQVLRVGNKLIESVPRPSPGQRWISQPLQRLRSGEVSTRPRFRRGRFKHRRYGVYGPAGRTGEDGVLHR